MDNYKEDHEIGFDKTKQLHPYGEPDAVNGWYSTKLSYREWYQLACAKRAHQEQVENSPIAIISLLLGSLKFPLPCLGLGAVYLLGTIVFARSYRKEGAKSKKKCIGRCMMRGSLWALSGLALVSAAILIKDTY